MELSSSNNYYSLSKEQRTLHLIDVIVPQRVAFILEGTDIAIVIKILLVTELDVDVESK